MSNNLHLGAKIINPGSSKDYQTGCWRYNIPVINKKNCANCFTCVQHCPENCIKIKDNKLSHIDFKYCKGCGICARECSKKAITMKRE